MFFFFFNEDNHGVPDSLIGSINEAEVQFEEVKEALQRESEKKGLRNADLNLLNDWTPSKTSKIMAGKQKLTADDIRMWSRSLGCTPDPFVDKGMDFRHYNLSSYVRNVSECLEAYFDAYDSDDVEDAIIRYELPLSIISLLGVDASDYVIRTQKSCYGIAPNSKSSFGELPTYIRFWHKALNDDNKPYPKLSFLLSPENEYFIFSINVNFNGNRERSLELRKLYKDILQVEDAATEEFNEFALRHGDWVPESLKIGEIFSFGDSTNSLPGPGDLERCFVEIFKKYCNLVWETWHIDIMPEKLKEREPLTSFQTLDILNGYADFDFETKKAVREREGYKCENDAAHRSFTDRDGHQYMEVVPIIPFTYGAQYGKAILSEANGICLCPNCAAQLKNGCNEDREDIIIKVFRKHKAELEEKGIEKSLTNVLADNGLS